MSASLTTRRTVLAGGGLVVAFAMTRGAIGQSGGPQPGMGTPPPMAPQLPGDLSKYPYLDSWIAVDARGHVTVFTGKAELGQGIKTALLQLVAEELEVATDAITLITADTARTPDEGVTAGSHSMQDSGTAILNAAANVRLLLSQSAGEAWGLQPEQVKLQNGSVHAPDGRTMGYGPLAARLNLHVAAQPNAPLKAPVDFEVIGKSWPRVDIPAKLTGGVAYVHDLRLPDLLHARVARGPSHGTQLKPADLNAVGRMPGVVKVVREGRFTAVVAETEWAAIQALRQLQARGWMRPGPPLPSGDLHAALRALPSQPIPLFSYPTLPPPLFSKQLSARFTRPYLMHGSIGPSCAVAQWRDGALTVWTHSQGVGPLKKSLADLLSLGPDKVRCIHMEGAGCYGHNGADDVAADAALAARAVPGAPVRLQWMREQEHGWEPLGPAMTVDLNASLDEAGGIVAWRYESWSNEHNSRPTSGGGLMAGQEMGLLPPAPKPIPMPEGGASRNSNPLYALPNAEGTYHFISEAPIRVSALRSLGAHMNVFAMESFMDELAHAARQDPVAFRLAHLTDQRGQEVIQMAAERFRWNDRPRGGTPSPGGASGCGFAFARYKNLAAWCAVAMEAAVEHETGRIRIRRAIAAVDCGEAVNPDGVRNQIEGAIVQALSWTTQEETRFDALHRTSFDWSAYPILRFEDAPETIEVNVIDRPGQPFLGTGETGQGPAAAAIANAVADATGVRLRDMPLSPERVKAAIGV